MQLRGTMILVLVVWLLLGWVRSQEGGADSTSRHRRDHHRRRTLEKLAARGLTGAEQERMAEEILARLFSSSTTMTTTTTTTTTTPPQLRPHRHRHHHQLRPFNHLSPQLARLASEMAVERPPESASLRYSQEIFEETEGETDLVVEEEEEDELERDSSSPQLLDQYMETELMGTLNRGKRERTEQERRNPRKNRRNERKQECRKRRERCKQLKNVKRRRRRRDREVNKMINETRIELHEGEDGTKYIDCCPSKLVSVNKTHGKGLSHRTMDIKPGYRAFMERVCLEGFENKECIIPANALKPEVSTRCVQQYSYSQAFIRPMGSDDEWQVGSIQVASGCSCQVSINHKKKRRKRKKR